VLLGFSMNRRDWMRMGELRAACLIGFLFLLLPLRQIGYCEESMNNVIENIKKIESDEIRCNKKSDHYFGYVKGTIPILISAPHGAKHYRTQQKRWKAEDAYTSSIAIELGRLTGAYVIYVKNKAGEDPNNDVHTKYKDFLRKTVTENGIKFLIDLHGAGWDQPFKIDVGTLSDSPEMCSCPTYRPIIQKAFIGFDEHIFNKRFLAGNCGTITNFARNDLGIEAAQIEINARYRIIQSKSAPSIKANEEDVLDLFGRLERVILNINERIVKGS
jgi:hypothetical protein